MVAHRKGSAGASAIEFGLILPLLILILLGIIDYGFVFYTRLNMTNAAREGARVGVTQEAATIVSRAQTAACNYLAAAGLQTHCGASCVDCVTVTAPSTGVDEVSVTVSMTDAQYFTLKFAPQPTSMTVQAKMRWELAEP
jgi:Flp pilus assembly protein TadG